MEKSCQKLGSEDWTHTRSENPSNPAMQHPAPRQEMHARTHTRHEVFKCNSSLQQVCKLFFSKIVLVMTWLFVRYHYESGAFLAQQVKGEK